MQNNSEIIQNTDTQEENSSGTKKNKKWTIEEDNVLQQLVAEHGEKNWRQISNQMLNRTPIQCLHRWTKILKPGLVKGPWSQEEDEKLLEWVRSNGPQKWSLCSETITGRSGKQCRERWFNNLNPNVKKGNWTQQEDDIIFKGYLTHGSSWSKIAKDLEGRTENSVKNRFYSTVRKLFLDSSMSQKSQKSGNDTKDVDEQPDKIRQFLQNHLKHNLQEQEDQQNSSTQIEKNENEKKQKNQNSNNKNQEENIQQQQQQSQKKEKKIDKTIEDKPQEENKKEDIIQKQKEQNNEQQQKQNQNKVENEIEKKEEKNIQVQKEKQEINENQEKITKNDDKLQNEDDIEQEIDKIEIEQQQNSLSNNKIQNIIDKEEISKENNKEESEQQQINKIENEDIQTKNENTNNQNNTKKSQDNDQLSETNENNDESDQSNVMKRKYSKVQEDYSQQNLLYRLLKEKHIPIKKTSCMKDYSVFYRKYKQNKNISKRKQKENEKLQSLKKIIEQDYGKNNSQPQQLNKNDKQEYQEINQQNSLFMQDFSNKQQNGLQENQKQNGYFRLDQETEQQLQQFFNDSMIDISKKFQQQFISPILQKQQQLLLSNSDSQQLMHLQQKEYAMYNFMNMQFQSFNNIMLGPKFFQPIPQQNPFYPQPMPILDPQNINFNNNNINNNNNPPQQQQQLHTKIEDISSSEDFLNSKRGIGGSQKNSLFDFSINNMKQEFQDTNSSKSGISKNKKLLKPILNKPKIVQENLMDFNQNLNQKENFSNFSFDLENNPLNPHKNSKENKGQSFIKTKKTQQLLQKQDLLSNFEKYGALFNELNQLKKEKEKQGTGFTEENDQKILFLLSQLESLEGMLKNTKTELNRLEVSMQAPTPDNMSQSSAPNISQSLAILAGKNQSMNFLSHDQKSIPVSLPGMAPPSINLKQEQQRKQSGTYSDFDKFITNNNND